MGLETYHQKRNFKQTPEPKGETKKSNGEKLLLQGLKQGSISFVLEGEKLHGTFSLIWMKDRQQGAWLLIKKDDEAAISGKHT